MHKQRNSDNVFNRAYTLGIPIARDFTFDLPAIAFHPNAAPLAGSIRLRETKIEDPRIPILGRTENNTFSSS